MKTTNGKKSEFWQEHVTRQMKVGGSIIDYCRGQGLSSRKFGYWRKKLRESQRNKPLLKEPMKMSTSLPGSPFVAVEVNRGILGGRHVGLPDARWLGELILTLHGGGR